MFKKDKATGFPKDDCGCMTSPRDDTFFAVRSLEKNGSIDPAYLMLAYAFDNGWTRAVVRTNYELADSWRTAAEGLQFLAGTLPGGFATRLDEAAMASSDRPASGGLFEVSLDGGAPPDAPLPLERGDIFTPNANGFHNIPRST